MPPRAAELMQGTLDILILKALTWGPMHGYAVASWIERVTDDALRIEEGSLYPALHRLEERELVGAEWGVSENNRRAKFYRLTPAGRGTSGRRRRAGPATPRPSARCCMPRRNQGEPAGGGMAAVPASLAAPGGRRDRRRAGLPSPDRTEEYVAAGLSPDRAREEARRRVLRNAQLPSALRSRRVLGTVIVVEHDRP